MNFPAGTVMVVRHAKASGQEPDAPLTPEGETQAHELSEKLADWSITRIVSSPWARAVNTIRPLANRMNLTIQTDERLTERVLSGVNLPMWQTALKASFAAPHLKLPGGESGHEAKTRAVNALNEVRDPAGLTVLVSHGNLLALLLGLDFNGWAALQNPDVWVIEPDRVPYRLEVKRD